MGKKSQSKASSKDNDKKLKIKDEKAKQEAMWKKVEAANSIKDPLRPYPKFKKYETEGLSITFDVKRSRNLDENTVKWAYELTKTNMEALYEQNDWEWNTREKMAEMTEEGAWYLIARDQDHKPVAFSHFRYDVEIDTDVLFCYEIQIESHVQRKGLGIRMMTILELLANTFEMTSVMLTVFKKSETAQEFFMNKLKYTVDEISPDGEGYSYQILSKLTSTGRKAGAGVDPQVALDIAKGCC